MKIAIFGPDRRVGVVQENRVIDINAAYAKYLAETTPTARPLAEAAAAVPTNSTRSSRRETEPLTAPGAHWRT